MAQASDAVSQHFQNKWSPETGKPSRLRLEGGAGLLEKEGSVGVETGLGTPSHLPGTPLAWCPDVEEGV